MGFTSISGPLMMENLLAKNKKRVEKNKKSRKKGKKCFTKLNRKRERETV